MKNIALVHDFLLYYGGAEKTLSKLCELYPNAPVFTLLANEKIVKKYFSNTQIKQSFLAKAPKFLKKRHKHLFPLMPTAVETFNLRDYDIVISSSSSFAKGIVVKPKTVHVCYMHAPMRYVWDYNLEYLEQQKLKGKSKIFARLLINYLRLWDRGSADRADKLVANSNYTADRIKKYYRRNSQVVFPPVDVSKISAQKDNKGYFLTVGRLAPYKRTKLIVEVFSKLNLPLIVAGTGSEYDELKKIAAEKEKIKILGWVDDEKLIELYQNARAFICASDDDFNITVVESMAAGKPVIALRRGGATETVIEGVTGEFFNKPKMEIVADGVRRFIENEKEYDSEKIRARAEEFGTRRFKNEFHKIIKELDQKNESKF